MNKKLTVILMIITGLASFFVGRSDQLTSPHITNMWHPPALGHHHGADPTQSDLWPTYLAHTGQAVGYPWLSSPIENDWPWSAGKHEGFKFLSESDLGCEQHNQSDTGLACITDYLLLVHTVGNIHALHTRVHSQYGVFRVCFANQCGLVATGGHADYGVMHNGYKVAVCQLATDPPNYPYTSGPGLNHPPYRAAINNTDRLPTAEVNPQFWNTMGPGVNQGRYYPDAPNNILRLSWASVDAWDYPTASACGDHHAAIAPCPDGSCALNHTAFQVFAVRLQNLPTERPFSGYTNVNGHVDPNCTAMGPTCVPLYIEASVPVGDALLARGVRQGRCDLIPCQEFDDGTPLRAPGH